MEPRGQIIKNTSNSFRGFAQKIRDFFANFMINLKSKFTFNRKQKTTNTAFENAPKKDVKKALPFIIFGLIVLIALALVSSATYLVYKNVVNANSRVSLLKPKASEDINREFSFPLFDEKQKEVTKFKYAIEKAELRDEIIVNGKRARSVSGRTFLVLTVKIANDYNLPMKINSRDYVRLTVNDKTDQSFAADAHSDPIEVQPISTEHAILGFAINDTDKKLILHVGEIKGEKQEISLSLK